MEKTTLNNIKNFELYLTEEEKSFATIEKYKRDVTAFFLWAKNEDLTKKIVLEYKEHIKENYSPASVNSMLSSLNAFFTFLKRHDLTVKTLKIQRKIFTDEEKELTKAEYERLLDTAKKRKDKKLYYLIQTVASTGLRVSEIKYVTTKAVKSGRATINCKGKIRQVLLPKQLCKMLKGYIKEKNIKSGSVFVSKSGKALDRSNIWKMLKSLCERSKVSKEKVFPHNFRHLFARMFYSLQKDIIRLADILGHSNVNTTRIYTVESGEIHIKQLQELNLLRY